MDVSQNPPSQTGMASRQHQSLTPRSPFPGTGLGGGEGEVRATIAGFDGIYALLNLTNSNELIRWPKSKIPPEAKLGDALILEALSVKTMKDEELTRMRKLLEELIN